MAKTPKKEQSNGISDLIHELWRAAVYLRGSIEPADYKRYGLTRFFLRFRSIRFDSRRQELQELVREPCDLYYTGYATEAKAISDDPDEYRNLGAITPTQAHLTMEP